MPSVAITVDTVFPAPLDQAFEVVTAEDVVPKLLKGFGPIPAVVGTTARHGTWDRVGSHRVIQLADGGTVREELTGFDRPWSFDYRVTEFSPPFSAIVARARGQWTLEEAPGGTRIRWTYAFEPRSLLAYPLLLLIGQLAWRGVMGRAFENLALELGR